MRGEKPPTAILIAGPTASGKSQMAIKYALDYDGVIINADSMQVYRELQIITARPNDEELSHCEHQLYGHKHAREEYSVALWLADAKRVMLDVQSRNKTPIFVGGTGLYFSGLMKGLSPVPSIKPEVRRKWREFALSRGEDLYQELQQRDPISAKKLRASDHQRLIRALEVYDSTGKTILEWQEKSPGDPLVLEKKVSKILKMPERSVLHERINQRFECMIEMGAVEEVARLLDMDLDPALPIMKAIGVPQFARFIAGEIDLETASKKAKSASRQYAKRQSTWFNNQFGDDWERL